MSTEFDHEFGGDIDCIKDSLSEAIAELAWINARCNLPDAANGRLFSVVRHLHELAFAVDVLVEHKAKFNEVEK